jgi:hypothetical protein
VFVLPFTIAFYFSIILFHHHYCSDRHQTLCFASVIPWLVHGIDSQPRPMLCPKLAVVAVFVTIMVTLVTTQILYPSPMFNTGISLGTEESTCWVTRFPPLQFAIRAKISHFPFDTGSAKHRNTVDSNVTGASPPHPHFGENKLEIIPINGKRNSILL